MKLNKPQTKSHHWQWNLIFLFCCLSYGITGCQMDPISKNLKKDLSTSKEINTRVMAYYLNNGGCAFPCWWGIEPGKTTLQQVKQEFSSLEYIQIRACLFRVLVFVV